MCGGTCHVEVLQKSYGFEVIEVNGRVDTSVVHRFLKAGGIDLLGAGLRCANRGTRRPGHTKRSCARVATFTPCFCSVETRPGLMSREPLSMARPTLEDAYVDLIGGMTGESTDFHFGRAVTRCARRPAISAALTDSQGVVGSCSQRAIDRITSPSDQPNYPPTGE